MDYVVQNLKKGLSEFGLNPADWHVRVLSPGWAQVEDEEDNLPIFWGTYEEANASWQKLFISDIHRS
ncbi:MAG: hypothetical protein N2578_05555 [Bdellovibrionaceae bacterium]|nr:hypothetical protein [Pseudobdellovibrionaceae bacterium]